MDRLIYILAFCILMSAASSAQLSFDGNIFPQLGDSLTYKKDMISVSTISQSGANLTWDFRRSDTPLYTNLYFKLSKFAQNAENEIFECQGENLTYLFRETEGGIEEIGFILKYKSGTGIEIPVYYNKALPLSAQSLIYKGGSYDRVEFGFELNRAELPMYIQKNLPREIEEIRISGEKLVHRSGDAWGKLQLPGESMTANRIRVIESVDIRLYDTRSGKAIQYLDKNMLQAIYTEKLNKNYFEFYTDQYKSYTARVDLDDEGRMTSIDYQTQDDGEFAIDVLSSKNDFVLYPNPTYNIAKVFISNVENGPYSIAIYNIIGKKLWQRNIQVNGRTIIKENFGFLPKGTYLISLLDENGNILKTTRLIIISV